MKVSDIEGIVLKSFRYQESSLIGEIYTESFGLRTFIAKGLSSKKNQYKRIVFRPPQIVKFTAYLKEHKEMNLISDIDSGYMYHSLYNNVKKGTIALFHVEMFHKVVYDGVVHSELYHFLKDTLINLDSEKYNPIDILRFMAGLAGLIGIALPLPDESAGKYFDLMHAEFTDLMPGHSYVLNEQETILLKRSLLDRQLHSTYSGAERKRLFGIYITYFRLHIDGFKGLHSPEIIKEVLLSS